MSGQQGGVPVGSEAETLGCLPAPPFPLLFSSPKKTWGKRDEAKLRHAKAMDKYFHTYQPLHLEEAAACRHVWVWLLLPPEQKDHRQQETEPEGKMGNASCAQAC